MQKSNIPTLVLIVAVLLLLTYIVLFKNPQPEECSDQQNVGNVKVVPKYSNSQHVQRSKNIFSGSPQFSGSEKELSSVRKDEVIKRGTLVCDKWAVVTSIREPTRAVERQAQLSGTEDQWCLVVVADHGSPEQYKMETPVTNFVFLSVKDQMAWENENSDHMVSQSKFIKNLPWGHMSRKNVGYLYAILHGARYIWDFDDDVMVLSRHNTIPIPGNIPHSSQPEPVPITPKSSEFETRVPSAAYHSEVFNPFPLFEPNHFSWPRGFPLDRVLKDSASLDSPITTTTVRVPASSIGVLHFLANHDPDVDSLYRMVRPLPLDFPIHGTVPLIPPASDASVVPEGTVPSVPAGTNTVFLPYNAQTTLHMYTSLWALLLPLGPHQRVADIWRSYIAQRLFADIGVRLAIHAPIAAHIRQGKEENLSDMLTEVPLFADSLELVQMLRGWVGKAKTLPGRMEELYVFLYQEGFLGLDDLELVQRWIAALLEVGYEFPAVVA